MTHKVFKILDSNGNSCHGGNAKWRMPTSSNPGDWMPSIEGDLIPSQSGYHLCFTADLLDWMGETVYEAEYEGEIIKETNYFVARKTRLIKQLNWNVKVAQHFLCDITEHVLYIVESNVERKVAAQRLIDLTRNFSGIQEDIDELKDLAKKLIIKRKDSGSIHNCKEHAPASLGNALYDLAGSVLKDTLPSPYFYCQGNAIDRLMGLSEALLNAVGAHSLIELEKSSSTHFYYRMYIPTELMTKAELWKKASIAEQQWQTEKLLEYLYS